MTSFTSRYGDPAADYAGAHVWAHCRHSATVVAVAGRVDTANVGDLGAHIARLVPARASLVLDLSGVTSATASAVGLLETVAGLCAQAGVDLTLVPGDAVTRLLGSPGRDPGLPLAASAAEAEHRFDEAVLRRRRMLLPLLRKTA